jgi:arsenical pump membrane protein
VVVVVLMLVGFAVASPYGVEPVWVCLVAALVLAGWAVATRTASARDMARATHLGFAIWVLAVGIVVEAAGAGFLGDLVDRLLPGSGTSYGALLLIAVIATALANLLTNLPATLLLAPLLLPLGSTAILAALIGLNVGSGLTWTGSLANLLWRRTLTREGQEVSSRDFHRISLVATPVAVLAAVTALWLTS